MEISFFEGLPMIAKFLLFFSFFENLKFYWQENFMISITEVEAKKLSKVIIRYNYIS